MSGVWIRVVIAALKIISRFIEDPEMKKILEELIAILEELFQNPNAINEDDSKAELVAQYEKCLLRSRNRDVSKI